MKYAEKNGAVILNVRSISTWMYIYQMNLSSPLAK